MLRKLRGGSCERAYVFGPSLVKGGYDTTVNEQADDIIVGLDEVAAVVQSGPPSTLTRWVVGPIEEVCHYLREVAGVSGSISESRRRRCLAAEIEDSVPTTPRSPCHRLAMAINVDEGLLRLGLELAKVELREAAVTQ